MDDHNPPTHFGVTPVATLATMSGFEFVRAMFANELPAPPMMQLVGLDHASIAEPGIVVMLSTPSAQHINPLGGVHGGYAATMLDSVMGLAVHSSLPPGTGFTTLEFKVSFVRGMTKDTGQVRSEGRTLNVGRQVATAEARITDAKGRLLAHATTTCLVFPLPSGT